MSTDVLNQIQNHMIGFSKGQKLIANYIMEYYDKAAFMTASKLGKTVNVSESTVVRFAVELGYEGYPEMQRALQEMIRNKLTSVQRIEVANDRIGQGDVLSAVLHSDVDKIRQTLDKTDRNAFSAAVDAILNANNLYILGVRSAAALASFFGFYMNLMFDHVHLVSTNTSSEMFEQIIRVAPGDAVLGISFPRYSSRTVKALRFCHDSGATVIALTDSRQSPIAEMADHVLVAESDMISLVDSLVAPMSLINALLVAIARKREEELQQTFEKLERIWDEYEVYEKVEL
ncbi:MAG: MurR/RpiR family transcriptional regulator [Oscillospiraceae bacterium]|nr:MurR/RpiR family transcriptional regulator [Oscillospiraceae bacterium]